MAQYERAVDDLITTGEITLNKDLYNKLGHYHSPFDLYFVDNEGKITVGGYSYYSTQVASYEKGPSDDNYKLSVYYGESGDVDLKETALVYQKLENLEELSDYEFQSPWAKEIYEKKLEESKYAPNLRDTQYFYWRTSSGSWYPVRYRTSPTGTVYTAYLRWKCWNESYTLKWNRRRSKGGTITQILRVNQNGGWQDMIGDRPIGTYHENGQRDYSKPYVEANIQPNGRSLRYASANQWQIESGGHGRDKNRGTTSYHSAKVRDNNSNTSEFRMDDYKVN